MEYKIKSVTQKEETLFTVVEYVLDGQTVEVSIPHFSPKNKEEIIQGIENRAASEKRKLEVSAKNATLLSELSAEVDKTNSLNL